MDADLVVGVPESGNAAALGYSLQSGIPYGTAFVKNSYVGRTFIKPKQSSRESSVRVKLNVLKEAVAGKRVIMIDDSIVRGTTSDRIVQHAERCRSDGGACAGQLTAVPVSLLFWNRYSGSGSSSSPTTVPLRTSARSSVQTA